MGAKTNGQHRHYCARCGRVLYVCKSGDKNWCRELATHTCVPECRR
jgi:hypothetical protein